MANEERISLFDEWALSYDPGSDLDSHPFPFDGYEEVSKQIVQQSACHPSHTVLDLGTGNSNIAARLAGLGCQMWGADFSTRMLELAKKKVPGRSLVQVDLLGKWPDELNRRFDRVVSAYVFHEFNLTDKLQLVRRLIDNHLAAGGRIVVGDISFPTAEAREVAHKEWQDRWDEQEHYWAADETRSGCQDVGVAMAYTQVSRCGGVYVFQP